jgi:hypothetical protein
LAVPSLYLLLVFVLRHSPSTRNEAEDFG